MLIIEEKIAKRYAVAWLNVHEKKISDQVIEQLQDLNSFLKKRSYVLTYLSIPSLSEEAKVLCIDVLTRNRLMSKELSQLLKVLSRHNRLKLFPCIINSLVQLCYKKKSREQVTIRTSHPLSDGQKLSIIEFVKKLFGTANLQMTFLIDSTLIMGIRVSSSSVLWERSINKTLQNIKKTMQIQVGL